MPFLVLLTLLGSAALWRDGCARVQCRSAAAIGDRQTVFAVTLADEPSERSRGLMFVETIAAHVRHVVRL